MYQANAFSSGVVAECSMINATIGKEKNLNVFCEYYGVNDLANEHAHHFMVNVIGAMALLDHIKGIAEASYHQNTSTPQDIHTLQVFY